MLREETTSSFSDLWYRIGATRPRLGAHAQVTRQRFGPHMAYIVEDPAAAQFYRLSEPAYFFVGLLDGQRTVDDAWDACNAQLGDDAPTQKECVDLLARLQRYGLLEGDLPLAPDMVLLRYQQVARAKFDRRASKFFALTIPLLNPEPFLRLIEPALRVVFSWVGVVVWLLSIGAGLYSVVRQRAEIGSQLNGLLDPANLPLLTLVFLLLRAWHEFGHAAACKAMGGRCTRVGILLLLLVLPLPFCDASSAWRFPEIWRRVLVSAAGMLFEMFVAGIAAVIWANSEPGDIRTIAYSIMVLASVTTLVFNANPLLRYDGYYILSDITGTPNLAQRSRDLWRFLLERYAFGVRGLKPPAVRSSAQAWMLGVYGVLSLPYRIFVLATLLLVIAPLYITLGIILASIAFAAWVIWPICKGLGYLAGDPRLIGRRGRAVGVTTAALAALVLLVGVVPLPAAGYASGTVEPLDRAPVRPGEAGFVEEILVRSGDRVTAGQPLLRLRNTEITQALAQAESMLVRARVSRDSAATRGPAERDVAERAIEKAQAELDRARQRAAALTVLAPIDGRVQPATGTDEFLQKLVGRFVTKGGLIGHVANTDRPVVRALVSDLDQAYVFRNTSGTTSNPSIADVHASFRVKGRAGHRFEARILRVAPAGSRTLSTGSLSTSAGGDILIDPTDPDHRRTLQSLFQVEVEPTDPGVPLFMGQRAKVRLGIAAEPLVTQLWRRAQQYINLRPAT